MIAAIVLLTLASTSGCDLATIHGGGAVHEALGQRAVSILAAAAAAGPKAEASLNTLVDPSASFDLIIGDVGSPGTGVAGARSFAKTINADKFVFLGWDYMDIPADACARQLVNVDFINTRDQRSHASSLRFSRLA
jgi:hypothetical protein